MPRFAAFLSYSRKDGDRIAPFRDAIETDSLAAWYDRSELSGGDAWESMIRRGLTQSNCLVVFVSENVIGSYAEKEIALARDMRKPIIPVALDNAIETDVPAIAGLREFQYIDARSDQEGAAAQLVKAIAKKDSAPVVSIYNVKGGVGKTTLTMNLGMYFYKQRRKRVLLVDFDPQTNLSTALILPKVEKQGGGLFGVGRRNVRVEVLGPLQQIGKSVRGLLKDAVHLSAEPDADFELAKYIHTVEGSADGPTLDIVVGDPALHRFATDTNAAEARKARNGFARFMGQCRSRYSCVLIDMGPSVSALSLCALGTSTHVLSPVTPNMFAMQGLNLLDDISLAEDSPSIGREHLIVINGAGKEDAEIVRGQIEDSRFKEALLDAQLRSSQHFALTPTVSVNPSLNFLPAYGAWGPNPNTARQSLQNVAMEVGRRIGMSL